MPEKPTPMIIGIIFFIAIISMGVFISNTPATKQFVSNFIPTNPQPRLETGTFTPEIKGYNQIKSTATTPVFAAVLEYDPTTGGVFQKSTKKVYVDMFIQGSNKMNDSRDVFAYKLQVTSSKNTLIQDGWYEIPLILTKTPSNTIIFQIQTLYKKGAIVRVMLPNEKIIWTGTIE